MIMKPLVLAAVAAAAATAATATRPGWRTTTVYHVNPAVYGDTLAVSPYVFLSIAAYGRVCVDVVVGVTSFFRELTALPLPRSETRT